MNFVCVEVESLGASGIAIWLCVRHGPPSCYERTWLFTSTWVDGLAWEMCISYRNRHNSGRLLIVSFYGKNLTRAYHISMIGVFVSALGSSRPLSFTSKASVVLPRKFSGIKSGTRLVIEFAELLTKRYSYGVQDIECYIVV